MGMNAVEGGGKVNAEMSHENMHVHRTNTQERGRGGRERGRRGRAGHLAQSGQAIRGSRARAVVVLHHIVALSHLPTPNQQQHKLISITEKAL